jgi:hypothetical protein
MVISDNATLYNSSFHAMEKATGDAIFSSTLSISSCIERGSLCETRWAERQSHG